MLNNETVKVFTVDNLKRKRKKERNRQIRNCAHSVVFEELLGMLVSKG